MSYQPKYQSIIATSQTLVTTTQHQLECNMPHTDTAIAQVLSCGAGARVTETITNDDQLQYKGFVNFRLIYEDQARAVQGLDYTLEFQDNISVETKGKIFDLECTVLDCQVANISSEPKLVATIEISVRALVSHDMQVIADVESKDTVFTKTETLEYDEYQKTLESTCDQNIDLEIKDCISKVLAVCPTTYLEHTHISQGLLDAKGCTYVSITYLDAKSHMNTYTATVPFTMQVADTELSSDSYLLDRVCDMTDQMQVSTTTESDRAFVTIHIPVAYIGHMMCHRHIDVVCDCYTQDTQLLLDSESFDTTMDLGTAYYTERIDSTTTPSDLPDIDDVVGVPTAKVNLASVRLQDSQALVEGVVTSQVICYSKQNDSHYTLSVDVPFSIPYPLESSHITDCVCQISVVDLSAKCKQGNRIEVFAKLQIRLHSLSTATRCPLSALTVGEPLGDHFQGASIYVVAKDESIWDIAKLLALPESLILEQNPDIALPLECGNQLFIYR